VASRRRLAPGPLIHGKESHGDSYARSSIVASRSLAMPNGGAERGRAIGEKLHGGV